MRVTVCHKQVWWHLPGGKRKKKKREKERWSAMTTAVLNFLRDSWPQVVKIVKKHPDVDVYRKRMAALFWWVKQSGLLKVQKVPRSCKQVQRGAFFSFSFELFCCEVDVVSVVCKGWLLVRVLHVIVTHTERYGHPIWMSIHKSHLCAAGRLTWPFQIVIRPVTGKLSGESQDNSCREGIKKKESKERMTNRFKNEQESITSL